MLFETLDKLKRNSIMSSILLIALRLVIILCPMEHVPWLIVLLGYTLIVVSIVMMLNIFSGSKSLMEYVKFVGALVIALVGLCVLLFQGDVIHVLAWAFGFLLVLDGGRTMYHSFTYARRS